MVGAVKNNDYRFDVQLAAGLVEEEWFVALTDGGSKFEVKHDRRAAETGNVYVEFAHDPGATGLCWKPSGIATSQAACWIFVLGSPHESFVGVETRRLRAMVRVAIDWGLVGHQPYGSCPTKGALLSVDELLFGAQKGRC